MLQFFINRFYKDNKFSFLAKSSCINFEIFIHIKTPSSYKIHKHIFLTNEPEIIYVDINENNTMRQKVNYEVHANNAKVYDGKFITVSPLSFDYVKFGFVSCNDNSCIKSDNKKYTDWHDRGVSNKVWEEIQNKSYDIIIHNGDNIYNDSTYQEYSDNIKQIELNHSSNYSQCVLEALDKVRMRIVDLFCQTYSDIYQGQCMRECWNFHQIDDHDITDCFGTPGTKNFPSNENFHNFYITCKNVLDKYLIYDVDHTQTLRYDYNSFIQYNYTFNVNQCYNLVFLDTRQSLYFSNLAFSENIIEYCKQKIVHKKLNIIVTPRPLFHMSLFPASVIGLAVRDARDSTWHYKQYTQSKKFCNMLFDFAISTPIFVISGDIHETYMQKHCKNNTIYFYELVTSGVTRSAQIDQNCIVKFGLRAMYFFDRVLNFFCNEYRIMDVKNRSFKNNFGELVYNNFGNYTFCEK